MATLSSIVDLVHPADGATSVILGDTIWVLFDREMDETSISEGAFFVTGPDTDTWSGPGETIWRDKGNFSDNDDFLSSPGYTGIVQGSISFERINVGNYGSYTGYDTTGDGSLFRTKAIFTPTNRLAASTQYTVYLSGDEDTTDSLKTGVKSRTVFDPVKGANIGTGSATFSGSYTGTINDTFNVKIVTTGDETTAEFQWWKSSSPDVVSSNLEVTRSASLLSDGVYVSFSKGSYQQNDTFTVAVRPATLFTGNLYWSFTTGSGSIQSLPSSTSTNVIGTPTGASTSSTSSSGGALSVLKTSPIDLQANTANDQIGEIKIWFSDSISASGITSDTFKVTAQSLEGGIVSGVNEEINLVKSIVIDNNLVTLRL